MKILVTGATGFIGRHLIRALHDAGHKVTGSARGTIDVSPIGLRYGWMPADFSTDTHIDDWLPRLQGKAYDVVINAAGILREIDGQTFEYIHQVTPQAIFAAAEACGVKQIIQISALGDGDGGYYRSKWAADESLQKFPGSWSVLKPSVVYGEDGGSTRLFNRLASLPLIPLIGKGDQSIQPIHITELVRIIVELVNNPPDKNAVMDIVGPEPVCYRDFIAAVRLGLGKGQAHFISVPLQLARLGARFGDLFNIPALSCQSLSMLMKGNTGDPASTVQLLGKQPKNINEFFRRV